MAVKQRTCCTPWWYNRLRQSLLSRVLMRATCRARRPMEPTAMARPRNGHGGRGFRLQAPNRGHAQPGVGKIRNAVERCHNFFAQFGRVFRRFDRSARRYLGWLELAACIILLRSGFVS